MYRFVFHLTVFDESSLLTGSTTDSSFERIILKGLQCVFSFDTAMNTNKHVHDFQNTTQTYFIWGDNAVQKYTQVQLKCLNAARWKEVCVWFGQLGQQPPQVSRATWSVFCLVDLMKPRNSSSDTARIKRALEDKLRNNGSETVGQIWNLIFHLIVISFQKLIFDILKCQVTEGYCLTSSTFPKLSDSGSWPSAAETTVA